jgi:hypothetical protein
MFRKFLGCFALIAACVGTAWSAESGQPALQNYFVGKQVQLKIDMPGTQRGVDLRMDRNEPMDWKQYSSRLKEFGPAIRIGDRATVTTLVVKKNLIEVQLDGGGFGTFWDDDNTVVNPLVIGKSDYEKRLEREIRDTSDDRRRRELQRELDRVRSRRHYDEMAAQNAAMIAGQMKQQQVNEKRTRGGSRFNLRWPNTVPPDQLTPDALMALLEAYVDFGNLQGQKAIFTPTQAPAAAPTAGSVNGNPNVALTDLKRGMSIGDVSNMLGLGRQLSQTVSEENLKTQIFEYLPQDYRVEVTYVDGVVVRYSISSR